MLDTAARAPMAFAPFSPPRGSAPWTICVATADGQRDDLKPEERIAVEQILESIRKLQQ